MSIFGRIKAKTYMPRFILIASLFLFFASAHSQTADAFYNEAVEKMESKNYSEAIESLNQALAEDRTTLNIY
jgi:outer membrane protein assembly factor BamD (BamD/ComL family)